MLIKFKLCSSIAESLLDVRRVLGRPRINNPLMAIREIAAVKSDEKGLGRR